jgi:hypothetical protein
VSLISRAGFYLLLKRPNPHSVQSGVAVCFVQPLKARPKQGLQVMRNLDFLESVVPDQKGSVPRKGIFPAARHL